MDLQEADFLACRLMMEHGLGTWTFGFDNAKRRCGACHFGKRRITVSRYYVAANSEGDIRDTVLHEIAHALAGAEAGHGPEWQAMARRVGARPNRCADTSVKMPAAPWLLVCTNGHRHGTRHRKNRNMHLYVCGTCRASLRYVRNTEGV